MKYFNHSEVSCFFVQNSSYIVEFQRAFPLSICTWILQFSSLKYRVWWTGFFPSLNWLYLVCKIQVWSRPKIQFIRLKDWKNQVGIDRIHIAFSFISSRIPNTMWAEFLMWVDDSQFDFRFLMTQFWYCLWKEGSSSRDWCQAKNVSQLFQIKGGFAKRKCIFV